MANDYCVVADQNFFHQESDDALTFEDVKSFGRGTQARQERRKRLCQAQMGSTILRLRHDRLQFGMHRLLPLAQFWHPISQFVQRQEILPIRSQQTLHALAHPRQIALQALLTFLSRRGLLGNFQSALELFVDETRILQKPHDFIPNNFIEKILAHRSIAADCAVEVAPTVRAEAAVVVDLACAQSGRGSRKGISTLAARYHSLTDAECNRSARSLHSRPLVARAIARYNATAYSQRSRDALTRSYLCLSKTGGPLVGRVA
jgi:hypothetical protein